MTKVWFLPAAHRHARRYLIERFPYCLYYREVGEGVGRFAASFAETRR